jgi:hypothetical protein
MEIVRKIKKRKYHNRGAVTPDVRMQHQMKAEVTPMDFQDQNFDLINF